MIEQQVADRFRDAVADEPPLGFDPDDVIDRAIKRGRRRKVVWAVAAATMVEAAAVWTLAGHPGGGSSDGGLGPAARPNPTPALQTTFRLSLFEERLTVDIPVLVRPDQTEVRINGLVVDNPNGDDGSVRLMRGNEVLEDISLHSMTKTTRGPEPEPKIAEPGVPVTLTVICTSSANGCRGVSVTVSGYLVAPQG